MQHMLPKSLRPLAPYFWMYRWGLAFGAVTVLFYNVIAVTFPIVIGDAANALLAGVTREKLFHYVGLLILITFSKSIFQFLTRWNLIGISREIEFDLRNDLLKHLETLSYSYYQRTRTGDIMARLTNDLNAVRMLL